MDIKQIHYFTEVVKQGSFSKAAEHLYVSQPNISNVIKELEKELDAQLLIRTTRKLELTDAGSLLFQYGQKISQSFQHFYQELDDIKNNKKGTVKIGIFPILGMKFFTKIISDFHQQYPEITVQFMEDGASILNKALLEGELDLVVMPLPIDEDTFDYFPFLDGDLRLLVHINHPLAKRESVRWAELQGEQFIIFREGFSIRNTILEECRELGFEPKIICETSQWNFMLEMVEINQGITILPKSHFHDIDITNKALKGIHLIDPHIHWHLGIGWKKAGYLSHATKTWINFVKERL